jgi:DNA polymerase-4
MSDIRAILHVDMDAFYASVEVRDDPSLVGKPVIVGGTPEGRGVVAAASYEARRYGIHSAMSAYRALKLCPDAAVIRPRMERYVEIAKQIRVIFNDYTPLVEPISIDEAFLDVTGSRGLFGSATEIAKIIKRRIRDEIGLTASVGVSTNKFLAKLASDLEKPDGLVVIRPGEASARLAGLPAEKLWGVGKVTQKHLAAEGIRTIGDLLRCPLSRLEEIVGSHAGRLRELARGHDERPVLVSDESKSIGAETTFPEDIEDACELRERLDVLCERVAKRLRKEGYRAHTVHLKARYADFTTVTRAVTLPVATAATQAVKESARELLASRLDRRGRALRLIGVSVSHLVRPAHEQPELFPDTKEESREKMDHLLDDLQERFGTGTIWRGPRRSTSS